MEVAKYLEKNKGLLKLGLTVKGGGARQMIDKYLIRNNDEGKTFLKYFERRFDVVFSEKTKKDE